MNIDCKPNEQRRSSTVVLAAALFVILSGIYSLTYSGAFKSGDEHLFVAGAISLGSWGQMSATPIGYEYGVGDYAEPLQTFLGAVMYQLARLGNVGVIHTFFLTNVYLTALTAVVVFLIVCQRGESPGVAIGAALIFGLGTLAWPHTKPYFRDPLAMFFVTLALWSFEKTFTRVTWYGQSAQWILTLGLLGAGILAKNTALFALPAFLLVAGIRAVTRPAERRIMLTALIPIALLMVLMLFIPSQGPLSRLALPRYLKLLAGFMSGNISPVFGEAFVGTLISPGKGLFVESPALWLAIVALPLTAKDKRLQHLTPWLTLLGLTAGSAYYNAQVWFGGTGWGVRHLLPVVPMLAAASAPALQAIAATHRRWVKLAGGGLILLSVFIQVGAVLLLPDVYYAWLSQIKPDAAWTLALWQPAYAEAVGYWRLLLSGGVVDLAWLRIFPYNANAIMGLVATWLVVIGVALVMLRRTLAVGWRWNVTGVLVALAGLAVTVMPYSLLRSYYPDSYYSGGRSDYRAAADYVTQAVRPGDAIVVRDTSGPIWKFFINYVYSPVVWYTYPLIVLDGAPSAAVLDNPAAAEVLTPKTEKLFTEILPQRYARFWLVSDLYGSWDYLRLEERWLAQRYVAVASHPFQDDKYTTLVSSYALTTLPADQPQRFDFRFGDSIRLTGVTRLAYAGRTQLKPGDTLPLRLDWQLTQPLPFDYTIGAYLLDANGALKAQQDGWAHGGFLATTRWPVETSITDQRGLDLPEQLPAGEYQVAVAVYNWQTGERLVVSGVNGAEADNLARVLTVQIDAP